MELLVLGHAGARVVVFPTSMGRFFEWEDRGMAETLGEHLSQGWVQLFCVDSVDSESWYAKHRHPGERAWRHVLYDRYLTTELLPFTVQRNSNQYLITTGASFGAYHAANFGLRHPNLVGRVLGLSGLYDIKRMTDGYSDDNVYFNNPPDFVQHERDRWRLEALRRLDIILAVGRDDVALGDNRHFSHVLGEMGIGHQLLVWDGWAHDWPWWRQMVHRYIGGAH